MKLSDKTILILKNFSEINQGMRFVEGTKQATISPQKQIFAEAELQEDFPIRFCVYDLKKFLTFLSLYGNDCEIQFDDKHLSIIGYGGRDTFKYYYSPETYIVVPPEKKLSLPTNDISLELTNIDLEHLLKVAAINQSPKISIESNGKVIWVSALDPANPSGGSNKLTLNTPGDGVSYQMLFFLENFKLVPDDYKINVSKSGISEFIGKNRGVHYFISLNKDSKYGS